MKSEQSISLVCEPCEICKKTIILKINKEKLIPSLTGVTTVVDIHGLKTETPHVRILYVDERNSVRSFSTITAIAREEGDDSDSTIF
ncbi:MAG: hypothetical protein ACFFBD_25195 [Candidatus Hodarchaeota archaeon]